MKSSVCFSVYCKGPLTTVKHLAVRITGTQIRVLGFFLGGGVLQVKEEQEKPICILSPNAACLGTELFVDGETCVHLGPSTLKAVLSKTKTLASGTVYRNSRMNFKIAYNCSDPSSLGSFSILQKCLHISLTLFALKNQYWAGELAPQLRALGLIPSTHMVALNSL